MVRLDQRSCGGVAGALSSSPRRVWRLLGAVVVLGLSLVVLVGQSAQADPIGTLTAGTEVDSAALDGTTVAEDAAGGAVKVGTMGSLVAASALGYSVYEAFQAPTVVSAPAQKSSGALAALVASGGASSACGFTVPTTDSVSSFGVYTMPWGGAFEVGLISSNLTAGGGPACVLADVVEPGTYDKADTTSPGSQTYGTAAQIFYSGYSTGNPIWSYSGLATPSADYQVKWSVGTLYKFSSWLSNGPSAAALGYQVVTGQSNSPHPCGSPVTGCDSVISYPANKVATYSPAPPTAYNETLECAAYNESQPASGGGYPADTSVPDQTVTYSFAVSSDSIVPPTCAGLVPPSDGSVWFPKKVTVTTSGGTTTQTTTAAVPAPTGQKVPIPGPAGQTVTGVTPGTPPVVTTTPVEIDQGAAGDPDPLPPTAGDENPDPGSDPCVHFGFSLSPSGFVLHPVECALQWAFEPQAGYLNTQVQSVQTAFAGTVIGKYLSPLGTAFSVPSSEGCDGIHVHYDVGLAGSTRPVDEQIGAACSGQMASDAAIVHATLTGALWIGGGWAILRLVVNGFFPGMIPRLSMSSDDSGGDPMDSYNNQDYDR